MLSLKFSHPLQWPPGHPVTPKWERSLNQTFKPNLTMKEAITFLHEELDELGAQQATLNTDYENIDNPRQMRRAGNENSAVLHMKMDNVMYRFACDRWVSPEQNIYSLHLALRNLRSIIQWGIGSKETIFAGFAASSHAHTPTDPLHSDEQLEEWRLFLGLGPTAQLEDAQAVYRRRAKMVASNEAELMKLNLAMEAATKALAI